jgi:hypothetical protein
MKAIMYRFLFLCSFFALAKGVVAQQKPFPVIAVKNINNKILISWLHQFSAPIVTLNIQRSFDSLRNYKTIGSVLSPQNKENGFADPNPPYLKMYYRVFVSFEGGTYMFSNIVRPSKDSSSITQDKFPWLTGKDTSIIEPPGKPMYNYPSSNIFTAKDNTVILRLSDAVNKKYSVKFYDDNETFLFELKKIKEDYLIIEKVAFKHTGWFRFELYENGELMEDNKFLISKDGKKL